MGHIKNLATCKQLSVVTKQIVQRLQDRIFTQRNNKIENFSKKYFVTNRPGLIYDFLR